MKDIQEQVRAFCETYHLQSPPEHQLLDTFSELGEVAKEILKMSSYGRSDFVMRDEVKGELGDVLFSLVNLANSLQVDLGEELASVLEKYKKRLQKGNSPGSEVEAELV